MAKSGEEGVEESTGWARGLGLTEELRLGLTGWGGWNRDEEPGKG